MACPEIDQMRRQVCQVLKSNVNVWQHDLQARWGDPKVYEAQQADMQRQEAALEWDLSRRNSKLLEDAYATRAQKQRSTHESRLQTLKSRGYRNSTTHPESRVVVQDSHTG